MTWHRAKYLVFLLLLVSLGIPTACGGGGGSAANGDGSPLGLGPEQVFGGDAPVSAVALPPEEFAARLADGRLELVTLAQVQRQEEDALAQMAVDRARAEQLFADRMDILERHTAEPDPGDPNYEPLADGSWRLHLIPADPRTGAAERHVSLQGRRQAYAELADTLERYQEQENQLGVYRALHGQLDPAFIDRYDLPEPSTVAQSSFPELEALNLKVAQAWTTLTVPPSGPPPGHPGVAANEEGHGGIEGADYAAHTGMWPQLEFPLKWYTTSVKEQGERGACVAFGITAAVETIVARDQARWTNLSEQMLYNRAKQKWWPSVYGDNLNTSGTLSTMLVRMYRYSWESSWDYNRSLARQDHGLFYTDSDKGKGSVPKYEAEHCSDANHQASLFKTETMLGTFCAFVDPATTVPPDAKFAIGMPHAIGAPGIVQLALAKVALVLSNPVIISVTVADSLPFAAVGPDGIVAHNALPYGSGGHCMLLVGYVENADLPPGTPPGDGGGYFVCKNSWGPKYGDGGYCYLSDAWVATWGRGLWVLDGVLEI